MRPTRLRRLEIHRPPADKPKPKLDIDTNIDDADTSTAPANTTDAAATTSPPTDDINKGADARGLPVDSPLRILFLNETEFAARYPSWTKPAVPDRQAPWIKKHPVYSLPKRFVKKSAGTGDATSSVAANTEHDDNGSSGSGGKKVKSLGTAAATDRTSYTERKRMDMDDADIENDAREIWGRRDAEKDQGMNIKPVPRKKGQPRDDWKRSNKIPGVSDIAPIEEKRQRQQLRHQKDQAEQVSRTQAAKAAHRERKLAEVNEQSDDGDTIVEDYRPHGGTAASTPPSAHRRTGTRDTYAATDDVSSTGRVSKTVSSSSSSGTKDKYAPTRAATSRSTRNDDTDEQSIDEPAPKSSKSSKSSNKSKSVRAIEPNDDTNNGSDVDVEGHEDVHVPHWAQKPSDYDGATGLQTINDSPVDSNRRLRRQPQDDARVWQSAQRRTRSQLNAQRSGRDTGNRARAPDNRFDSLQWPQHKKGMPRFNDDNDGGRSTKRQPPPSPKALRRKEEQSRMKKKDYTADTDDETHSYREKKRDSKKGSSRKY